MKSRAELGRTIKHVLVTFDCECGGKPDCPQCHGEVTCAGCVSLEELAESLISRIEDMADERIEMDKHLNRRDE